MRGYGEGSMRWNVRSVDEQCVGRDRIGAVKMRRLVGGSRVGETAYPVAELRLHSMFMVLHWAVVGFGNATPGTFQSKKNDCEIY